MRKPVVLFAIPGGSFTPGFFDSWTKLTMAAGKLPFDMVCTRHYSPVIYHCRANLLGADNRAGEHQIPFQGKLNYDYMMWLDTDINFTVEQVVSLFESMQKKKHVDVLCGIYLTADGHHSTIVKDWDVNFFLKTGMFPFLTIPQLKEEAAKSKDKLAKVFYAGMGFMMVRKGAFEKVTYPWFEPIMHEIEMSRDFSSEDVSLCWKWAEKGVGIYIDPEIVVGHEKSIVIR
jgi:GT2 family glycosyltransferase